ncbi:hypothetical protein A0H81_03222 [Grifola frondosa]|uniref:Fungal-type protein kinase domain-containing protein n=1 Tax=Grifola frondosa TaxID=5627 RepID=A0A1C7MIT0_GRIFR|nr:hypothetical protein A0H81_03222 [Grifola frondosa]
MKAAPSSDELAKQKQHEVALNLFLDNHLAKAPSTLKMHQTACRRVVAKYRNSYADDVIPEVCKLLNVLSKDIYAKLSHSAKKTRSEPIFFLNHCLHPLAQFPKEDDTGMVPDAVGVRGPETDYTQPEGSPSYKGVPYHRVETLISWTDSSGSVASPEISWKNIAPLAAYIQSLYSPPPQHLLRDTSVVCTESKDAPLGLPTWKIKIGRTWYADCKLIFVGRGAGRRTTVWEWQEKVVRKIKKLPKRLPKVPENAPRKGKGKAKKVEKPAEEEPTDDDETKDMKDEQHTGKFVIIKDTYQKGRFYRLQEARFLEWIHEEGLIPGVEVATACQMTEDVRRGVKTRFVMGSTGSRLDTAKSVSDLLKAIYDVLEVHRRVVMDCHILHRDMSINNILMYPRHTNATSRQPLKYVSDPPLFIDDILKPKQSAEASQSKEGVQNEDAGYDHARCVLIDWDNATEIPENFDDENDDIFNAVGTPTYVARSVNSEQVRTWGRAKSYVKMPELTGKAKELYEKAHEQRCKDYLEEPDTFHGGVPSTDPDFVPPKWRHRPEHDVESVFWSMLVALLRVIPKNEWWTAHSESEYRTVWKILREHRFEAKATDERYQIFEMFLYDKPCIPAYVLPTPFLPIIPLIKNIMLQVQPEYAAMGQQPPKEDHLHEAIQRLIFQYLVDHGKKSIPLMGEPYEHRKHVRDDDPLAGIYRPAKRRTEYWDY